MKNKWEEKSVDALLIGKVDAGYYPIRLTVSEAIKHGRTQIKELRAPPPFVTPISTARFLSSRPETLDWNASRHNFQRTILRSFAHSLRSAKVCVFDGSIEEKAIRKFSQPMLSGCVITSNLVTEHDSFLKGNIIQLDLYDNIETINAKISAALVDEHELQRKASACLAYARQYLTGIKELDLLIDLSQRYRKGQRGYVFPYGFTARCRRYHQTDDGELQFVPSWCRSSDRAGGFGRGDRTFIQPGEYHWTGPDPP
ncbi:hypothetical protein CROQUDRAFT_49780 [Cronartium quercuum f. sp. fusiforme G11]|uniref:Uncharacterized protein n=1 Tax=Cronartium quercuum f. sp. fusiforme G11 TaxID=708437 RepID=A0A9P6NEP0_9BASI|nr:hypothetical protein CROQUDRAFT_49780 [Cronartium quercuum f. sp. fusiforme G11]